MKIRKYYKGEKYIYLLMAVLGCLNAGIDETNKDISKCFCVGDDNNMVGGQNYYRRFQLQKYNNNWLLIETKNTKNNALFTRTFQIGYDVKDIINKKPTIMDYIDESGDNYGQSWIH